MVEQRIQDSKVRMTQLCLSMVHRITYRLAFLGQIHQFPDENIKQDSQIIRVEILLSSGGGEEEVENLEDEELHTQVFWRVF